MEARAGTPRERQRICSAALAYSTWTRCANGLDLAQVGVVGRTRDATSTFTRVSLMRTYLAFTAALLALPACSSDTLHPAAPQNVAPVFSRDEWDDRDERDDDDDRGAESAGAVYTLGNQSTGNRVLAFRRGSDGQLASSGNIPTGGTGSGGGLGNQGVLTFTRDVTESWRVHMCVAQSTQWNRTAYEAFA